MVNVCHPFHRCRNSCLQLHEDAQSQLHQDLEEVHKQEILDLK